MGPQQVANSGETYVHPAIACAVLLACVLILILPRKRILLPFFASGILIPWDQVIILGPLHFSMLRVVILVGWIRMLTTKFSSGGDLLSGGINAIDKAFFLLSSFVALNFVFLNGDFAAVINQAGALYTTIGTYIFLRFLITDDEDIHFAIRALAYVTAVIALLMSVEAVTGHNPYAIFGGARAIFRENGISRDDRARAMGPFGHPILAGTFGAISLPIFFALWLKEPKNRRIAALGIIAATVMVITSNSSTPVLAYLGAIFVLCLWPMRKNMRLIRWGVVIALVSLHMVMKAPVWALIGRIDLTGSSSSYHRFQLVDQCIRHFGDWWLIGAKDYGNWGWDMWDLANQYVAVADVSGLIPLVSFVAMIVYGFKYAGILRKSYAGIKNLEWFAWALGAAMFGNVVAFLGISYFDQTVIVWYTLLALISAAMAVKAAQPVPAAELKPAAPNLGYFPSREWKPATKNILSR